MDITIDVENYKLNIRAGVIINHHNKVLLHRNIHSDHYALLGGRVEIGESSEQTVTREVLEETGKEIELTGYIATIENFFKMEGNNYHEILFVHQGEFVNEEDKEILYTLKNVEGQDHLQYEWIDLDQIDKYPLRPEIMKEILKKGQFPVHKVNIDK